MTASGAIVPEVLARLGQEPRFREHYRLEGVIGRGGMSVVAGATDLRTHRPVAVKVFDGKWTPEMAERFVREGRLMAQVRHPHVLQVYDLGFTSGVPYLVTEFAPNGSLRQEIARGACTVERIAEVMVPVLQALAALHQESIIHRDLKPDNILFGADGQPRVADFGLALVAGEQRLTATGAFVGSVAYAAPEMLLGDEPAATTDVYAVGVMLYEMLSGRPPFSARNTQALLRMIAQDPPPPLSDCCPDLAPEITRTVFACLAKIPGERPDHAAALADGIARWPALAPARGDRKTDLVAVAPAPKAAPADGARTARRAHKLLRRRLGQAGALLGLCVAGLALRAPRRAPPAVEAFAPPTAPLAKELGRLSDLGYVYLERFNNMIAGSAMMGADDPKAGSMAELGRQAQESRTRTQALIAPLRRARAEGRALTREELVLYARGVADELCFWWVVESCRRMPLGMDARPESDTGRAVDADGLALVREFQELVLAALSGAEVAQVDGELFALLLDDARSLSRGGAMHEWGLESAPRFRAANASFARKLQGLGPLGDAVTLAWAWGAQGGFRRADRAQALAGVAALRALARRVPSGADALERLAARIEHDASPR